MGLTFVAGPHTGRGVQAWFNEISNTPHPKNYMIKMFKYILHRNP